MEPLMFWVLLAVNVVATLLLLVAGSIIGKWLKRKRSDDDFDSCIEHGTKCRWPECVCPRDRWPKRFG